MSEPAHSNRALAVLLLVVFINLVGFGVVIPLLPFYAKAMNAAPWQVTTMFAAYSLGQFFGEPFWGRLSDRIGRRPVLIITIIANTLAYLALAFAPNIWVAMVIRLFGGFGSGNISTIQGYMADVTPPEKRAGRMGLLGAAFGAGFVIGPGLVIVVQPGAGHLGFQLPLFLAAGMAATAAVGVILFVKESRAPSTDGEPQAHRLEALSQAAAHPILSRVLLVTLISTGAFAGMESVFGLYADTRFGWKAGQVAACFLLIGLIASFGQGVLTGRLARRFGEARVMTTGLSIIALSLLVTPFVSVPALAVVAVACTAFGQSLVFPCVGALISRATPSDRQGQMLGLNMAAGSLARIGGPLLAGPLFGFSIGGPYWFGAALMIPAIGFALVIVQRTKTAA